MKDSFEEIKVDNDLRKLQQYKPLIMSTSNYQTAVTYVTIINFICYIPNFISSIVYIGAAINTPNAHITEAYLKESAQLLDLLAQHRPLRNLVLSCYNPTSTREIQLLLGLLQNLDLKNTDLWTFESSWVNLPLHDLMSICRYLAVTYIKDRLENGCPYCESRKPIPFLAQLH